jgi:hypothetical protein
VNRRLQAGIVLAGLLLLGAVTALAQTGGQFCVRSYQDTNGNGVLDAESEALLTRGVGVELLNADNVIIASALLDRSPNADSGVVCFQNLPDGTYSVLMSSADYTATSPRLVERNISVNGLPVVVEFGAQRISSGMVAVPVGGGPRTPEEQQDFILQLAFSTVGTVLIVVLMLLVGMFIYVLRLRRPAPQPVPATAYQRPPDTQQPPVRIEEPPPPSGSTQPGQSSLEETGPNKPVDM